LKIFHFLDLGNITIHPPKNDISCFFYEIRIFRGTFSNSSFFILIYFILRNYLYYLSYIIHKYLIWVIFIMKCSYKVVQKLSKVVQKLSNRSQKNPKNLEKSRKIPKNPDFFTFFLMVSTHFL
jgi:hypothetical protein